ncbi:hypothetical protein SB749_08245 [Brevibacterium sp. SIMBA_078]|uniref:hypothetical protein n=1 Tax=Brevibacterium sp. SIMBA_078 TaxID=3085816 RepID=UPI00397ADDAD
MFEEAPAKPDAEVLDDYQLALTGSKKRTYQVVTNWLHRIIDDHPDWSAQRTITKHVNMFGLSSFGSLVRILSRNPGISLPVYVRLAVIKLYRECVDTAAVRGLLRAAGVPGDEVVAWVVESGPARSPERDSAIVRAIVATCAKKELSGRPVDWDAPIFALEFLEETELASRVLDAFTTDDSPSARPIELQPIGVGGRAAVVVRTEEVAELQRSIDQSRRSSLSLDAIYLAMGLSRHNMWDLVLERPVRLGSATVARHGFARTLPSGLVVKWTPMNEAGRAMTVEVKRSIYSSTRVEKLGPAEQSTFAVLASMFSNIEALTKSHASRDEEILLNQMIDAEGMSAIYRFENAQWWNGASRIAQVTPPTQSVTGSPHSKHDVRGHWRYYSSGSIVWIRPHTRGR